MGRFTRQYVKRRSPLAQDAMPRELRHALWTPVHMAFQRCLAVEESPFLGQVALKKEHREAASLLLDLFWIQVREFPINTRPRIGTRSATNILREAQEWFYDEAPWYSVYDTIDLIGSFAPGGGRHPHSLPLLLNIQDLFNQILASEMAPWQFVNGALAPVSGGAATADTVDHAIANSPELVRLTIQQALDALSMRPSPDVHSAITKSIAAVESMAKHLLSNSGGTYGSLVQSLKARGVHPAFAHAFDKLYGYTSDAGGLRHAFKPGDDPAKHAAEGRMFVVMTTAYVNYLLEFYSRSPHPDEGGLGNSEDE